MCCLYGPTSDNCNVGIVASSWPIGEKHMGRITQEQYRYILKMRKERRTLAEIQAYMAKCMLPDAYHEKPKRKKSMKD